MSLRRALEEALQEPGQVTVEVDGLRAQVEVVDLDRLGAVVRGLTIHGPRQDVGDRATRLAQHLRPGGEELLPVEVDRGLGGATLRSLPQERGRDPGEEGPAPARDYYELQVSEEEVELKGMSVGGEGVRNKVPFTWTREQLGRSIDQLERALRPEQLDEK